MIFIVPCKNSPENFLGLSWNENPRPINGVPVTVLHRFKFSKLSEILAIYKK